MIVVASIPRCGSTYLVRSILGEPQGGSCPDLPEWLLKTHRPPHALSLSDDDRCVFLFGDVAEAVVSTQQWRHDPHHFGEMDREHRADIDLRDVDYLGYRELYESWKDAPVPVLYVRYTGLRYPMVRGTIERWLGRDIAWLPWRHRRTTVTEDDRARVRAAYGRLVDEVNDTTGVFITGQTKEMQHG